MSQSVEARRAAVEAFFDQIPHTGVLGMEVVDVGESKLLTRIQPRPELVGDPYRGYVHGGVLTTLIDQTSGTAAFVSLETPEPVATLDLRVDHLRAASVDAPIYALAECYRVTRNIAFVRCVAYQDDPEQPVATSMSSFMRTGARPEEART
ncbi:PaaI family thioesterase [Alkalilimnicola sp. S0819]|uniref:PaaI family thioesterase n=1 Tax=Alkalilimnicola sp. S0819 TaxID=2613922 RepID=UPI0012618831|nr:PaaI family thioesterase [Alkalilimnicola sp. S0819]KAB7623705.1 PaaI family thioesterase [Alkalilimnicola sp. S0819]MPQ16834.1 hotdog fold thioesterase [Alkalilimnicola sp. S0819]